MTILDRFRLLLRRRSDASLPPADPRRWAILAHYDADGVVAGYVVALAAALRGLGANLMVVSTAPGLDEDGRAALGELGATIHLRANRGFDFGSWQYGLGQLPEGVELDELVLANDSVFGPLADLSAVHCGMRGRKLDFWGITDSLQQEWHLQSYFLCFGRDVIGSDVFRGFWRQPFSSMSKGEIIRDGEIGLSQRLAAAGFSGGALCPVEAVAEAHARRTGTPAERYRRFNPTHFYWETLIRDCGCPFVKKELLRDNPERLPGLHRWKRVVRRRGIYDPALIEAHMRRLRGRDWMDHIRVTERRKAPWKRIGRSA